jgi:hypothetical protein
MNLSKNNNHFRIFLLEEQTRKIGTNYKLQNDK